MVTCGTTSSRARDGTSDSEKLLVLVNACSNFLTDPTVFELLPNVESGLFGLMG